MLKDDSFKVGECTGKVGERQVGDAQGDRKGGERRQVGKLAEGQHPPLPLPL